MALFSLLVYSLEKKNNGSGYTSLFKLRRASRRIRCTSLYRSLHLATLPETEEINYTTRLL